VVVGSCSDVGCSRGLGCGVRVCLVHDLVDCCGRRMVYY